MNFPSTLELLKLYNIALAAGPAIVILGIGLLRYRRKLGQRNAHRSIAPFATVAIVIGGVFLYGIYGPLYRGFRLRGTLNSHTWSTIDMWPVKTEMESPQGAPVKVTDAEQVQRLLRLLDQAKCRFRNHESLEYGTEIVIRDDAGTSVRLRYYGSSTRLGQPDALVAFWHDDPVGEFTCRGLGEWINAARAQATR